MAEIDELVGLPEEQKMSKDDEELFKFIEISKPKIYVIGAGGSGCNTMNRIFKIGIEGAMLVAANTDVRHLIHVKAHKKILFGKKLTKGLGAGSDPEVGEAAAKESVPEIRELLKDAAMVFITCGLGGGTGTGSAPIIAEEAKNIGALTIAVVTLPFTSEGKVRRANALEGLAKLKKYADTVIIIPNDKLLSIVPDLPLDTAFKVADEVLASAAKGITELVTKAGLVNLDFADLKTIMKNAGCAVVGMGESSGDTPPDRRALVAIENALSNPLLDVDISEVSNVLVNVTGGEDMTLREAELIVSEVSKRVKEESHVIWGARVEKELQHNIIKVLVVLSGARFPQYELETVPREIDIDLDMIS